jgi:serine/threonine protein phosphatase PrpC
MANALLKPVQIEIFGKTDIGRTRAQNEDRFLTADLTTGVASRQSRVCEQILGERGALVVVADGMGGAAAGEQASEMATEVIYAHLVQSWANDAEERGPQRFAYRLKEAVEMANGQIHACATSRPELRGMGTTGTVAGLLHDHVYVAQVGDSRAYLVRGSHAYQLTRDQSLVQRLVELGELTEEEAETSSRRNVLLQALGPSPGVDVDLTSQRVQKGDVLVLCSDGLSAAVSTGEIAEIVGRERRVADACERLIALANERGGHDNITVVLVRLDGAGLQSEVDGGAGYAVYRFAADRRGTTHYRALARALLGSRRKKGYGE